VRLTELGKFTSTNPNIIISREGTNMMTAKSALAFFVVTLTASALASGIPQSAAGQEHPERAKFHGDVAHALLEMNVTLDLIEAYRAQKAMPPDSDAKHEKAAHGFKQALELFGVKIAMPIRPPAQ
jgi:hypothetical protein